MKKFFIILFIGSLISFIGIWQIVNKGYDRQNKVILAIKKIIPSHLARKVKETIFFIPNLMEKNRDLSLQVKKFEQGLNGELFKEQTLKTDKDTNEL